MQPGVFLVLFEFTLSEVEGVKKRKNKSDKTMVFSNKK